MATITSGSDPETFLLTKRFAYFKRYLLHNNNDYQILGYLIVPV
jgi:hypothetical protein